MEREQMILLIVQNSDFTYEELEQMTSKTLYTLYEAHVLEKNGG
ncbi:hypothetical protein AB1I62_08905 [Enterococcus sp. AN402]